MRKSKLTVVLIALCIVQLGLPALTWADIQRVSGKLTMLRVHDVGSGFGPSNDFIDVEVVFRIDSKPDMTFGFQLRDDSNQPVRQGMLDLLRDALNHNWTVHAEFTVSDIEFPKKNNAVFRIWLTK